MTLARTGQAVLSLFVVSLGYGVVVPVLPKLAGVPTVAGSGEAALSAVFAAYSVCRIGLQVPGGLLTDRHGPIALLRVALPLFAASLTGFLLFEGAPWAFLGLRALEGAATGLAYPACFALAITDGDPATSGKRLSTLAALGTSGLLLGPALGALFPESPRVPVAISLGLAVLLAATIWRPGAPRHTRTESSLRPFASDLRALMAVSRQVAFLALMAPVAFNKLTFSAFQGLLPLVGAERWPEAPRRVLSLFVLIGVVFAAAQPVAGFLADRVNPRRLVLCLSPCLLLALCALPYTSGFLSFSVAFGVYIFVSSLIFTATLRHGAQTFGTSDTFGGIFGLLATVTDLATIVGPLLFLNLYGWLGEEVFLVMAATGLLFAGLHAARAPALRDPALRER